MTRSRSFAVLAAAVGLGVFASAGAAAPDAADRRTLHFQSPSRNINCLLAPSGAECVVKRHSWRRLRPRPASCDLDWVPNNISLSGDRLFVGACRGDIGPLCVRGSVPCSTLRYGRSVTVGSIRCISTLDGVTCRRTVGRRVGFRIAREGYVLYR